MTAGTNTREIQAMVERLRHGDQTARNELIGFARARLHGQVRRMMNGYPRLRRLLESDDVVQAAAMRVNRALGEFQPENTVHFFRFTAVQVQRELIDLSRHFFGPHGYGTHWASDVAVADGSNDNELIGQVADSTNRPERLAQWSEFHSTVARLPGEQREVFDLLWYNELTAPEAAELLELPLSTIKSRWRWAKIKLRGLMTD